MNDIGRLASGFTLAEILVSTLLLSIFAVGTFKSAQFSQSTTTATLTQFQNLHLQKQLVVIRELTDIHPVILVDNVYPRLVCLIRQHSTYQASSGTICR